ncbi:MAG: type II toxin-antitoxin system PemK/MazF family toxin [Runella zeae]
MTTYSQYEIVVVNLDPTIGSDIKKKRPCLVVSPNEMNKHLATIVICPITSQSKNYPTRVSFDLEGQQNWIVIDQIRTIDKSRVTKAIGNLDEETIEQVKAVIKETFVD